MTLLSKQMIQNSIIGGLKPSMPPLDQGDAPPPPRQYRIFTNERGSLNTRVGEKTTNSGVTNGSVNHYTQGPRPGNMYCIMT